ncbi:molybdate ABC transporter substrate-binding protein [Colwellia psychrerythraea]|uniref:Molybdenum ABC transporter, periplasmic molybdate-binding protein n=1 Tax=Colwellia psychrerythraea TaxID=28229 RepID=A0A099KP43_COLPS|nr:molybdate ABC transporter substrate-binding protein [Colwellia psychrerythraea]KGJ91662.1 molybdenum ABC transporter, periplasmic molybdate-binding protein [Colwellia psychrerythraea]
MLRFIFVITFVFSLLCAAISQAKEINVNESNSDDNSKPLRIAVAANFSPVLKVLLTDFRNKTGINSQIISGASGAMFLQIKHGAPYDIFLSADRLRPTQLEQAGYAIKNSRKTYAIGQLAFYSSSKSLHSTEQLSIAQLSNSLLNNPPKRFAIANPDIAPYGKAAKEALSHLGLWQSYKTRLIKGINIGQTFTQIRTKAVTNGLVAYSQLVLNNLPGLLIPSSYHQPIEQQLIIIRTSKRQEAAQQFSDFLLSAQSQATIVSYGYAKINRTNG